MASPVPTEPQRGNTSTTPEGRNRLALTSFWLSLAPLIVWAIYIGPRLLRDRVTVFSYLILYFQWTIVIYLSSLIGSIVAIVIGGLALSRLNQKWKPLAIAGMVMGGINIVILVGVVMWLYFLLRTCVTPGCL